MSVQEDVAGVGVDGFAPDSAAMFAVLMILAITTIAGAPRSDIHGGGGRRHGRGRLSRQRR